MTHMLTRQIRVAHSPDSDDAFMFYALAANKIQTGELQFEHVLSDIETLNEKALEGEYEVTAISFHAYAYLTEKYALLTSGASMGDRYGPLVISKVVMMPGDLKGKRVAVPGTRTTAFLVLKLFEPEFSHISGKLHGVVKSLVPVLQSIFNALLQDVGNSSH